MKSKWIKGLKVVVCISDCSNKENQTITYEEYNTFIDDLGRKVWFNETLIPEPYEGLVLSLDMDDSHICKSVEIVEIIKEDGV